MLKIELESDSPSYVLKQLFIDSMRKIGKKKLIKSMTYDCDNGLIVTDENDVIWSLEVNAKINIPQNELKDLPNARVTDDKANGLFCPECNSGVASEGICSVCEYLGHS